ncbi:unnamed protein product [Boreogadus saida]
MSGMYRIAFLVVIFTMSGIRSGDSQTVDTTGVPCASKSNTTCEDCLKNVTCLWCMSTKECVDYPVRSILPKHSVCPLNNARWGLCWVNFQSLIITMSVLAGIIIIAILVCCFCCCKCEKIGNKRQDARAAQQESARKARKDERKSEMNVRHEEVRQKYGLTKGNPYARMDEN